MTPAEIEAFMRRHGLDQMALAERLGVGQSTISRWLRGRRAPHGLLRLALLGLERELARPEPTEYLLDHTGSARIAVKE